VIDGWIGDIRIPITVDTGAQVTVVNEWVYQQLNQPLLQPISTIATGAGGDQLTVLGAMKLTFNMGGVDFPFKAWVIKGLQSKVLLGQDFGRVYSTRIETKEPSVTVEGTRVPLVTKGQNTISPVLQQIKNLAKSESMGYMRGANTTVTVVASGSTDWPSCTYAEILVKVKGSIPAQWLMDGEALAYLTPTWQCEGALLTNTVKRVVDLKSVFFIGGINTSVDPIQILDGQKMALAVLMDETVSVWSLCAPQATVLEGTDPEVRETPMLLNIVEPASETREGVVGREDQSGVNNEETENVEVGSVPRRGAGLCRRPNSV
jgi:hypothetical protein